MPDHRCIQLCPLFRASSADLLTSDYFTTDLPQQRPSYDLASLFVKILRKTAKEDDGAVSTDEVDAFTSGTFTTAANPNTGTGGVSRVKYSLDNGTSKDSYASMNSSDIQVLMDTFV